MSTRTQERIVTFRHPFTLSNADRPLPCGTYRIVSEEESIEGLSFLAYRSTYRAIAVSLDAHGVASAVPGGSASEEMIPVSLEELDRVLELDRHDGLNASA